MTATLPTRGPSTPVGGPPRVRLDARPGAIYGYDVLDPATGVVHVNDYVGQARDPVRRDKQHRGQIPQRDGQIREQPWADLIVGGMRILEEGVWSDAEMDARELAWMAHCGSRINCQGNTNPDRIPIYVQRQQRDARDIARGLAPRDWSRSNVTPALVEIGAPTSNTTWVQPRRSLWSRFWATRAGRWLLAHLIRAGQVAAALVAVWMAAALGLWLGLGMPARDGAKGAVGIAAAALGIAGWRKLTGPKRRRGRSRQHRTRTSRRRAR